MKPIDRSVRGRRSRSKAEDELIFRAKGMVDSSRCALDSN